jgi:hypothetical protein
MCSHYFSNYASSQVHVQKPIRHFGCLLNPRLQVTVLRDLLLHSLHSIIIFNTSNNGWNRSQSVAITPCYMYYTSRVAGGRGSNTEVTSRCWRSVLWPDGYRLFQFPVTLVSSLWMTPTVSHCITFCDSYSRNVPLFWTWIFLPFLCCVCIRRFVFEATSCLSPICFLPHSHGNMQAACNSLIPGTTLFFSFGFVGRLRMIPGSIPTIVPNMKTTTHLSVFA